MFEHEAPRKQPKPHSPRADCCVESECSTGLRNNYYLGKRLTPDAFRVEQRYLNERRHLLNRAIHGWGVVYGYSVAPQGSSGRLQIGAGLALDRAGRELLLVDHASLDLEGVIALDEKGVYQPKCKGSPPPWTIRDCWLLSAHYAEQHVGHVTLKDPCSCERDHWDRVCETVRFSLRPVNCALCCQKPRCELCCGCGTGPCCEESQRKDRGDCDQHGEPRHDHTYSRDCAEHGHRRSDCDDGDERPYDCESPVSRGGCRCLCDHLTRFQPDAECTSPTDIVEPCTGRISVDLHNGVPLACVRLTPDECGSWKFDGWVEPCGPRRLVKRNDVLFDLIQGCDLTRIADTGWKSLHRREAAVSWDEFKQSWGTYEEKVDHQKTNYWVEFSRPVRQSTVRPDCFAITVVPSDHRDGWGQVLRVPITDVQTEAAPSGPPGHVIRAWVVVDSHWVYDEIIGKKSIFDCEETLVEVEVRGDYIIDCNGQAVDAEAVGLSPAPTGNGAPGGRYLSSFRVAERSDESPAKGD